MSHFYVACDLGADRGRVMLGNLHNERLVLSEVRRFDNVPLQQDGSLQWDIPELYQQTLDALSAVGSYEEPVAGISCHSWGADYVLFEGDGSLITPTYHTHDPRNEEAMRKVLAKIGWETVYQETGIQQRPSNTLFQLAAESSRRLNRASHLIPVADAFNFLLAGVPRIELSLASTTQLYNPLTHAWSERLLQALRLPSKLLPPVVSAGTTLGPLRAELANHAKLDDAQVIATCSHEIAAALVGLPVGDEETWAYLRPGASTFVGAQLTEPLINEATRQLNFTNEIGYGGVICFHKHTAGLWILEECQRHWEKESRQLDGDMLSHLAGSAPPFESLINPADPRFLTPGDMPLKIQAFCKETHQPVPRKPGPVYRCILESLALLYRKILQEIESLTGARFTRLYLLGGPAKSLLNHFIANAAQLPVVVAHPDSASIGNVVVQAMALGQLKSVQQARELVRQSFKTETILPHANAWNAAYDRLISLCDSPEAAKA